VKVSVSVGFVLEVPGGKDRDELGEEIRSQIVEAFHPERVHVNVFLPRPAVSERRLIDLSGGKQLE
jgi:hypothetical protein